MEEIWKDIKGYEGLYQVSNLGQVKRLEGYVNHWRGGLKVINECILKTGKQTNGYLIVCLHKNGVKKTFSVHRLVAETFIPNPDNLPQVNHKDENKNNNCVDNLEWCNSKFNANFGTRNKRVSEKQLNRTLDSKPVIQYDLKGNFIKEWSSLSEIKRNLKISKGCITYACNGIYKQSHNYIWKWKYL